ELFTLDTVLPVLQLTSPNSGESWYIGDTNNILWNASDTNLDNNSIFLWFSLNGGAEYTTLAEAINNSGSFAWEIPSTQSTNAKVQIQVSDTFGNTALVSSLAPFVISFVPPAEPQGVSVDTSNGVDAVISWQPVTLTVYDTPITPDGYIVLYNETPYEDEQYYYFLGRSFTNTYTHHDVTEFRSQMFYRVIAYKNYRSERFAQLEVQSKSKKLLWREVRNILQGGVK
ncbi:MAG: hypothetical protein JXR56_09630, partial [Candidatus Cloacimonetes bacterium]|nr:hypothetical protein [Candidatus Cloacimonadota bacterium]